MHTEVVLKKAGPPRVLPGRCGGWQRVLMALACGAAVGHVSAASAVPDLVVGQSLPLTGNLSVMSQQSRLGADIYFAHVNAQGGVNGAKIRHVVLDDAHEPDAAVRNARSLIDDERAVALVAFAGTASVEELLRQRVLVPRNVALVGPTTGAASLRLPTQNNLFHVRAGYADEAEHLVNNLASLGVRRVGVFRQSDALGAAGLSGVEMALARRKLKLEGIAQYERGSVNVEAAAVELRRTEPEAIVLVAGSAPVAAFARRYRALGGTAHLLTMSDADHTEVLGLAGLVAMRGMSFSQVVPFPAGGSRPIAREYQAMLLQYGPQDARPTYSGLESYISAKVLVEALKRAGGNPSPGQVVAALEQLEHFDAGGYLVSFSRANRIGSRYVDFTVMDRDGKLLR